MGAHHFEMAVALGVVVCCVVFSPFVSSLGIRPFGSKTTANTKCTGETATSGIECACKLEGQSCAGSGLRCINKVCKCGPGFVNFTDTVTGLPNRCEAQLGLSPTRPIGTNNATGILVPCGLSVNLPIPGYNLTATNAVLPIQCDDKLTVVDAQTNDLGLSALINAARNGPAYVPYVIVNPFTLEIVPNSRAGVQPIPDPGNYFTQTICGSCLDQRAIPSNSFCLRITWWGCSGNCVATPAKSCSTSTEGTASNAIKLDCNSRNVGDVCNLNTQCCGIPTCSATGGIACATNAICTALATCVTTTAAGSCCTNPSPSTSCLIVGGTSCTVNANCATGKTCNTNCCV